MIHCDLRGDPSDGPSDILVIQNRRDPCTPYFGALRMRAALGGRARLGAAGPEHPCGGGPARPYSQRPAAPSACPAVASTWSGISSCRSPTVIVPVGSKTRIEAPDGECGLCSVPRGTVKTEPRGSRTVRSPAASRSEMNSSPSTTRKNSSVSVWACQRCSPRTLATRTS
ncbi:hypothetical protein GR130_00775 [Streptomyces sp. GS7]|nr:hypothetical protein GR130_00775 [Streptomyces sp. GS7]